MNELQIERMSNELGWSQDWMCKPTKKAKSKAARAMPAITAGQHVNFAARLQNLAQTELDSDGADASCPAGAQVIEPNADAHQQVVPGIPTP